MTGTERKRLWRERNPERSREAEATRAQARRNGFWDTPEPGVTPRPCASSGSYARHEQSTTRMWQRFWYPTLGAGAHRMTKAQRAAAIKERGRKRIADLSLLLGFDASGMSFAEMMERVVADAVRAVREATR